MVVKFVSFFLRHRGMPRPERSRADTVPCRYSSRRIVAAHLAKWGQIGPLVAPQHPERSPIRARVASVKRVLVIQLDHDLDSFLARARPLWGASSATTFGESQGFWPGSECQKQKEDTGREVRESGGSSEIPACPRSFLLRLDFFGWHDTVCLFGRSKPRSHPCSGESPL